MALRERHYLPEGDMLEAYESSVFVIAKRRVVMLLSGQDQPISIAQAIESADVSINAMAAVCYDLLSRSLIDINGGMLFLNSKGRKWALMNSRKIFMSKCVVEYSHPIELSDSSFKSRLHNNKQLPKSYKLKWVDTKKCS